MYTQIAITKLPTSTSISVVLLFCSEFFFTIIPYDGLAFAWSSRITVVYHPSRTLLTPPYRDQCPLFLYSQDIANIPKTYHLCVGSFAEPS